jgi:membrane protein implicated in regulation of membrane protease activity
MSRVRDHLVLLAIAMVVGCAALVLAGLGAWNPWLQLLVPSALGVICTRIFAPVYFGWRDPEDYPGRRTRQ